MCTDELFTIIKDTFTETEYGHFDYKNENIQYNVNIYYS